MSRMTAPALQTVLYVDADPRICEVVQTILCLLAGLEVQIAHCVEEAIDRAYEFRPDLILMDVVTPDGAPATLKQVRGHAILCHIPIAFLTADVSPAETARFLGMGAIGVIEKPFDPGRLGSDVMALWNGVHASTKGETVNAQQRASSTGNALTVRFLERADRDVVHLRDMVQRAADGDRSVLRDIELAAHSLRGSAAMFGFSNVSALSAVIERLVEGSATATHGALSAGETAVLQQLVFQVEQLGSEVAAAAHIRPSTKAMLQTGR